MNKNIQSGLLASGLVIVFVLSVLSLRLLFLTDQPKAQSEPATTTSASTTPLISVPSSTEAIIGSVSSSVSTSTSITSATADEISLLVVGDMMLDRNVADRTKKSGNPLYPFQQLPENWISHFDVALANLEGPVTPTHRPPEKSIDFQFDPAWLPRLKGLGWDAFSQANNHALDQGSFGAADSATRLREAGFITFGHQVDDGIIALATTTVKGERLAFLGWNTTDNPIDLVQAEQAIVAAKQQSDLVIAFLHWGLEYKDHPTNENIILAHWLIDHGVDVVLGGHPHWVQGISSYKGRPIAWSLGNFIFDQDWSKETQQGLALEFKITSETIRILPVPLSIKLSQPKPEEGASLAARLDALANISDPELQSHIKEGKELLFERVQKTEPIQ